ncbi:MAG: histone deacetylase [Caldilineaceae bacterium]|nr:histone deacetylase [Caldilineaceae bacterium]
MVPIVYHPDYVAPLPPGHRFPMAKFGKVYEWLVRDGIASLDQFHLPERAPLAWLHLAHAPAYVTAYCEGTLDERAMRRIGFPWTPALVNRTCTAVGGTILTAQLALQVGLACSTAGGTHHAFYDFGSGFCIFNDLAIAARLLLQQGQAQRVLIIDLDVHQGDGTAALLQADPNIFTFSMHCGDNFPFRKQQSDLDVELPVGTADAAYLQTLASILPDLLSQVAPDFIFYDAGVDPHVEDMLGKLALTSEGLYQRDYYVLDQCLRQRIPVATVIGGGYQRDIDRLARRHCTVHRAARDLFEQHRL